MSTKANGPKRRAPMKPKAPRHNPARDIANREYNREQRERSASEALSRASSLAPSDAGSPPPGRKCKAAHCTGTQVGPEGICMSCGTVVQEDSNIVSEIQFGETAGGAAYVTGVNVGFNEAGPRLSMANGNRQVAGNGGGKSNHNTIQLASTVLNSICFKLGKRAIPATVQEKSLYTFTKVQATGWVRGRSVDRVAAACLYYAIRSSDFTGAMLIDIADAISADVFILGRWFKQLLLHLHGKPNEHGKMVISNCPFEPLYPEDIIRIYSTKLGFKDQTEKVRDDAVRILQRMDRDWIVSGRKPAGICGTALIIAARMNDFRRTVLEIAYCAKIGQSTVELRLEEFRRVESAKLTVTDFKEKPFTKEAHDPPAYYRTTKEYIQEQEQKKAARKRKRPAVTEENGVNGEGQTDKSTKKQRTGNTGTQTSPATQPRMDADGFAIPARPSDSQPASSAAQPETEDILEEDITEAVPLDEADEELALASKYGDFPMPAAKEIRKHRMQGSALRNPECDEEDKLTPEEEEALNAMLEEINNPESEVYAAAARSAGIQKDAFLAALESTRPMRYRKDEDVLAESLDDTEFDDDPEVRNCLLSDEERKIKEKLWLNENKQWLREQQEKAYKAKTAPPKKARRKNPRKPRIGEGQTTPASSAGEAAEQAAKRLKFSKKLDYSKMGNMFNAGPSGPGGPGSVMGSAMTSAQTSRAGSEVVESENGEAEDEQEEVEMEEDDEDDTVMEYDEQANMEDDGEEFGGGYDDDDY